MRLAVFATCCVLLGCAEVPERANVVDDLVATPSSWVSAPLSDEKIEGRWWQGFGDAQLDVIVEEALAYNPSLRVAAARIHEAMAGARIVGADALPQVSGNFSVQRAQFQFFSPFSSDPQRLRRTTHGLSVNLGWELDVWGRLRAREAAALADVQAEEAFFDGAVLSLIAQVIKAYFVSSESWGQLQIAEENLRSASELGERIDDRYRSGLRPVLDLRLIMDDVAVAKAARVRTEQIYAESRRQLELLIGRYPAGAIEARKRLPAARPPIPGGLPSDLLRRRPDLVEAERDVAATLERLKVAEKDLLPRIALTASGGTVADDLADILDKDFGVWNLVGNLVQPIFEGGRLRAEIARSEAVRDGALARFADVALAAFGDVERALADEGYLRDLEEALDEAVREASASLEISEDRYFTGVSDILNILEARRRYFNAQSVLLTVQLERLTNRVDLYVALGGGYEGYAP